MRSRTVKRTAGGLCAFVMFAVCVSVLYTRNSRHSSVAQRLDTSARQAREDQEIVREFEALGAAAHPELMGALLGIETPLARLRRQVVQHLPAGLAEFAGLRITSMEDRRSAALRIVGALSLNADAVGILHALVVLLDDPRVSADASRILSRHGAVLGPVMPQLLAGLDSNTRQAVSTNYVTVLWTRNERGERWLGLASGLTNESAKAVVDFAKRWDLGPREALLRSLDQCLFEGAGSSQTNGLPPIGREFALKLMELIGADVWPLTTGWVNRLQLPQATEEREWMVWLIGLAGPNHATPKEVDALRQVAQEDEHSWVRVAAVRALGRLGTLSRPVLEGLLQGADEDSIQAARTALAELDSVK